jgi:hypothetical protein
MIGEPRKRKAANREFFPSDHKVRADGTAQGAPPSRIKSTNVLVRGTKPTSSTGPGIDLEDVLRDKSEQTVVRVARIEPDSLFVDTGLTVGMEILSINEIRCSSAKNGKSLLYLAEKQVKINAKPGSVILEPPSTPTNLKPKQRKKLTPFRGFMAAGNDKDKPAVIQQLRVRFQKTPTADTKRHNDFKHTIHHGLKQLGEGILRNKSPKSRNKLMKDHVMGYYDEERS